MSSKTSSGAGKSDSGGSLAGQDGQPNLRGYELSRNPRMGLETLVEELKKSPMAMMDFESLFGIWDMIQYLDGNDLAYLMSELEGMGGGQEMMAVRMMLLNRWAAKDGEAAMESVFEDGQGMMQMVGSMGAMMGWMRSDPEAAYQWVKNNDDKLKGAGAMGMGAEQLEAMYFANLARTDFAGTMAKIDGMEKDTQSAVIGQLAQSAGADPAQREQLLNYLKGKDDPELLNEAREGIVGQMAWRDPKEALAFIESENPDAEARESLEEAATSMWSFTDPAGAIEYKSERLRGSENAGNEIANNFGQWINQDEAAAAEWLAGQGDEFKTDSVFQSAGRNLQQQENYERSAEWYGQVLDQDTRASGYQQLYENWNNDDAAAAEQWRNSLPAEDQQLFNNPTGAALGGAAGAVIAGVIGERAAQSFEVAEPTQEAPE